jgi:oligopeptide/dipeptide ABC transporter ATP-binding protein
MSEFLKVSDVSVEYRLRNSEVTALNHVSLGLPSKGYSLGVVGESGSGKTTLGLCIMNVIEPPGRITHGSIEFLGKDVFGLDKNALRSYRWEEVAMVYQSAMDSLSPVKKASDHVAEVMQEHLGTPKHEARERAVNLLADVGIRPERANDYPHELSGGMRQRVIIALALALSPKLLIADEPTSALDVVTQRQVLALLRKNVVQRGLSLVFITHEISLLSGLVDNVAVMYAGEIVEQGKLRDVLYHPVHPYTEMLASTILSLESTPDLFFASKKVDMDMMACDSNTCAFANRCKYFTDGCRSGRPLLKETADGRLVACHKYS